MILKVVLLFVIIINGLFAITFIRDLIKNKGEFMKEDGNPIIMAISSFIIFVLSTFGISDFAVSTVFYRKMKFVNDKKLPGTLNTQCVLPVAAMALIYIINRCRNNNFISLYNSSSYRSIYWTKICC